MNPLDQLRDIHLPDSVQWWPLAIGWWLLAALLLGLMLAFWWRRKKNQDQREMLNHAEQSLIQLEADTTLNSQEWLQALSGLLRQIVINLHGRKAVAGLVGNQWLQYLDQQGEGKNFSEGLGQLLATHPYQQAPDYDRKALSQLVRRWLKSQTKTQSNARVQKSAKAGANNA